jgi:transposase InsO family protein
MKINQADYDLIIQKLKGSNGAITLSRTLATKARKLIIKDSRLYLGERELVPSEQRNEVLNRIYNDPATGLSGRDKLFYRIKQLYAGISRRDIAAFLSAQETAQIHARPPKLRTVKPIISSKPNERFQMDLIDMSTLAYWNDNTHFILTIIDHFTKRAWAYALKNKGSKAIAKHLDDLFDSGQVPEILQSDNGKEFNNSDLKAIVQKHKVSQVFSAPYKPNSNGAIERFNQTLKRMLFKYMTNNSTKVYLSALEPILQNYNTSLHRVIKVRPDEAVGEAPKVAKAIRQQARQMVTGLPEKISKGTLVRINNMHNPDVRKNKLLTKKYTPNYSKEIYRVISGGKGIQYYIEDVETGKKLNSTFYAQDLQPIPDEVIKPEPVQLKDSFFNREEHLRDVHSRPVVQAPITPIRSRKDRAGKKRRRTVPKPS